MTLRPGEYLIAGPAAYKVLLVTDTHVTVRVVAGSARLRGRTLAPWPRSNIEANIALGIIAVATEYAAPATVTAAPSLLGEREE